MADSVDAGIGSLALDTVVATSIVVGAITIVFKVGLIVLLLLGDQISHGEAIVRSHKVDGSER